MDELLESLFSDPIEIPILNCPDGLEGAEIEYEDSKLQVFGTVQNGKLVTEACDVPEDAVIVWGQGRWTISW